MGIKLKLHLNVRGPSWQHIESLISSGGREITEGQELNSKGTRDAEEVEFSASASRLCQDQGPD